MITVLTPTYNRAHTLSRVYDSLCAQTAVDFEWLVVDDGSTDETHDLVRNMRAQACFEVVIVGQVNSGKHVAINTGSRMAQGEWILILDSDDALVPAAIATINEAITTIRNPDLVGICFRKAYFGGEIVGHIHVGAPRLFLHPTEAGELFGGDLAYVFRRASLRSHPFPIIIGETFFPELYVWNQIGDDGTIVFFADEAIYLCEYLPDGYSANFATNLKRNPKGFLTYYRAQMFRERTMVRKVKCFVRALQCAYFVFVNMVRS